MTNQFPQPDWQTPDGAAVLYCGDCLDILPTLPAGSVDAVVTDPPYGIMACGGKWGKKKELSWDSQTNGFVEQIVEAYQNAIVWGGNYYKLPPSRGWLVWHKRDRVKTAADVELAWTSIDMNSRLIDCTISSTNPERVGHPTQKPVRVMQWSLSFLPNALTILDPFAGSGTTGVACLRLGRRFIGIEKERKYFDMALRRLSAEHAQGKLFALPDGGAKEHEWHRLNSSPS